MSRQASDSKINNLISGILWETNKGIKMFAMQDHLQLVSEWRVTDKIQLMVKKIIQKTIEWNAAWL